MPTSAPVDDTIGARIAVLRERRGWSGRFLASRAGISASTLSRSTYDYATLGDLLLQVIPELHAHGYRGDQRADRLLLRVSRATTAMLTGESA